MHLSALKFGISPPIFLWSTAAAAQSRGWLILSLFCSKACLSCQAKFNIYHKRTRRRSLNCVLIAGFTLTRHVAEKQYHFRLQGAYHMAVRCIANVVYWFSCSESNSNWLLYWRETPMRILHFYCAYLHTSTLPRIADLGALSLVAPPQAYAYGRASSSGANFTWVDGWPRNGAHVQW